MIPFASQRGGGQDLATHLMNAYDNEVTELAHLRGSIASDLHGAFKEWQVQAEDLTRCEKYLYSLSINPDPRQGRLTRDQYMDYIARTEDMLGLTGQPRAFVQSLSEQGYLLATGNRPYVLVDLYGGTHALARLIDDKAVRTADLRAFLGKDFPPESLPSVEEAIALVERHRAAIDKDVSEDERATALQSLKAEQAARRQELLQERQSLETRQQGEASRLAGQLRDARVSLRRGYLEQRRRIHQQRYENRPTGLAAFLGRVTGVEALRALLHRRQDTKAFKAYRDQLAGLLSAQTRERRALAQRHLAETLEQARREKALTRVDRREIVALLRDLRTAQRVLNRGDSEGRMPSLALVAAQARRTPAPAVDRAPVHQVGDLRAVFEDAATRSPNELPDVLSAFARAAQRQRSERETADDKAPALDRMARPPADRNLRASSPEHGPEPGRDRD